MADHQEHFVFEQEFVRYQRSIYGYLTSLLPNPSDTEEVFQATSLTLLNKKDQYDTTRPFLPWARQIAFFEACNYRRKHSRPGVTLSEDLMEQLAVTEDRQSHHIENSLSALNECMNKLRPEEVTLLRRCYMSPESVMSVAEDIKISARAVYKRLHRIRLSLFKCISRALET